MSLGRVSLCVLFVLTCTSNVASLRQGKTSTLWSYERSPSPVKNDPSALPNCSISFHEAPKCIDSPSGYRCKCPPGFNWNTKACVAEAADSSFWLNQAQSRNEARAVIDTVVKSLPDLTEMTITAWVKLDRSTACGTLVSYRVALQQHDTLPFRILVCTNHITVEMFENQWHIKATTNSSITWNWFHLAFLWNQSVAHIYINGVLEASLRFSLRKNVGANATIIRGKGDIVLGQTWNTTKTGVADVTVQNFDVTDDPRSAFKSPVNTSLILSLTNGTSQNTEFLPQYAFSGEVAMLNIWNYTGQDLVIADLYNDCTFMHCGKVIEWTDWRNGMSNITARWPSGIRNLHGTCYTQADLDMTCDKYCSALNGTKCTLEVVNNIVWPRVAVNSIVGTACPTHHADVSQASTNERYKTNAMQGECTMFDRQCAAVRVCDVVPGENYVARWAAPESDACLSGEHNSLRQAVRELTNAVRSSEATEAINLISAALQRMVNVSSSFVYKSPIDLETFIDSVEKLVALQSDVLQRLFDGLDAPGANEHERLATSRFSFNHTSLMFTRVMTAVNNLLHSRNDAAWNATRPPGSVGVQMMRTLEHFYLMLARSLVYHAKTGNPTSRELQLTFAFDHAICKVHPYTEREFHGVTFPDKVDDQAFHRKAPRTTEPSKAAPETEEMPEKAKATATYGHEEADESLEVSSHWSFAGQSFSTRGNVELSKAGITFLNRTSRISNYVIVTCAYPKMFSILPNNNWYSKLARVRMENNLNSVVFHVKAYAAYDVHPITVAEIQDVNPRDPVKAYLLFKNTTNISNPECVNLPLGKFSTIIEAISPEAIIAFASGTRSSEQYVGRWSNQYCKIISNDTKHAYCGCNRLGLIAVTTDMYDDSVELANGYLGQLCSGRFVYKIRNLSRKPLENGLKPMKHTPGYQSWRMWKSCCRLVDRLLNQPAAFKLRVGRQETIDAWREPIVWPEYVTVPSYIGCCVSIFSCFSAFVMLVYLKTSTKTASIHKNFALAIAFGQLSFMVGVERYNNDTVCLIFAILLHYFFLCTFAWLMNEALNLYIVITYAAHAHGAEPAESASFWRYYVFGWILPAIVVGATYGSHQNTYLPNTGRVQDKVCWIEWNLKWFFIGPAIGIISIATVVLVFTAKEHHESSYTKDEKSNRAIVIHSKALWTQAILLTMSWSFAILTLKMKSYILTLLFAMFNFLQGIFFLVFYFLLNSEVQYIYASQSFKGATTMLMGGNEAQSVTESAPPAGVIIRNSGAQISTHATRRLTITTEERQAQGLVDKLKKLTTKSSSKSSALDSAEQDELACKAKRSSKSHIGKLEEEVCSEPLLQRHNNAAKPASEAPSVTANIPMSSTSGGPSDASGVVSREQALSPTSSWTTDLLVTSV